MEISLLQKDKENDKKSLTKKLKFKIIGDMLDKLRKKVYKEATQSLYNNKLIWKY